MTKTYNLTGVACWAKIQGDPQPNYREDANEWSIDVTPDQKGIELLRRVGLGEKIRNKDDDRDDFITFRRNEFKKDGNPNDKIEVVDAEGNAWPEDQVIGNGSTIKVRFSVFDMPAKGKFKAIIKPVPYKVTVLNYIPVPEKKERPVAAGPKAGAAVAAATRGGAAETPTPRKKPPARPAAWENETPPEGNDEE